MAVKISIQLFCVTLFLPSLILISLCLALHSVSGSLLDRSSRLQIISIFACKNDGSSKLAWIYPHVGIEFPVLYMVRQLMVRCFWCMFVQLIIGYFYFAHRKPAVYRNLSACNRTRTHTLEWVFSIQITFVFSLFPFVYFCFVFLIIIRNRVYRRRKMRGRLHFSC